MTVHVCCGPNDSILTLPSGSWMSRQLKFIASLAQDTQADYSKAVKGKHESRSGYAGVPDKVTSASPTTPGAASLGAAALVAATAGTPSSSFLVLLEWTLQELADNVGTGRIPLQLTHHSSADSVKSLAMEDLCDHGNWTGSVVMLLLLFPETYVPSEQFRLMNTLPAILWLDGAGDRESVLRNVGMDWQISGKGQNNYRTNLLEALIGHLDKNYPGCNYARYLKALWHHVSIHWLHNADAFEHMSQVESFPYMIGGFMGSCTEDQ